MRLGVTRTAGMLVDLTAQALERRIEVVPIPLVRQRPVEFDWPDGLDPDRIDWLFFGSANGVSAFFDRTARLEHKAIPEGIDYGEVRGLKREAQLKLAEIRPRSLGQAGRVSGITPADLAVLSVWIEKRARE